MKTMRWNVSAIALLSLVTFARAIPLPNQWVGSDWSDPGGSAKVNLSSMYTEMASSPGGPVTSYNYYYNITPNVAAGYIMSFSVGPFYLPPVTDTKDAYVKPGESKTYWGNSPNPPTMGDWSFTSHGSSYAGSVSGGAVIPGPGGSSALLVRKTPDTAGTLVLLGIGLSALLALRHRFGR